MANPLAEFMPQQNPLAKFMPQEEVNPLAKFTEQASRNPLGKVGDFLTTPIAEQISGNKINPLKAIFTPLSKTLTGKSLQERAFEATKPESIKPGATLAGIPITPQFWGAVAKNFAGGVAGEVADIATTPASYIPIPAGKLAGKIPIGKTTLGKVATKVPLKRLGNVKGLAGEVALQEGLETLGARAAKSAAVIPEGRFIDKLYPKPKQEGKVYYHGTKAPINKLSEADPAQFGKANALYGEGLYLTDNPKVAESYATRKGIGPKGRVLSGIIKKDTELLNLEKELPENAKNMFKKLLIDIDGVEPKSWKGTDVYDEIHDTMFNNYYSSSDAVEVWQGINDKLWGMGYKGLKHIGGVRTKSSLGKHDVAILFQDPYSLKIDALGEVKKSLTPNFEFKFKNDPVARITKALQQAGTKQVAQQEITKQTRAKIAAGLRDIDKKFTGIERQHQKKAFMKQVGEFEKVQIESIADKIDQQDIHAVFDMIHTSPELNDFEKIFATEGLEKMFGQYGGVVPFKSQLDLLRKVFPEDFIETIAKKMSFLERSGETIADVLNIPRAIMSSYDMSAPLRQGVFLIGRPKQWLPAFGRMFKYFFDEKAYLKHLDDIANSSNAPLYKRGGLSITGPLVKEEAFASNAAERIPFFGAGVKMSSRAHTGFLNKLRTSTFDSMVRDIQKQGIELDDTILKNIGEFINAATGRGNLPDGLNKISNVLNGVFFSPKLVSSRMTLLNPQFYAKLDPFTRKEALKSLVSFMGLTSSVLMMAHMAGADVGTDPNSADFGKIKTGNTRYDIFGGFQQFARFFSQMVTGKHVSSTTGVVSTVGEGFKPLSRLQILGRFASSKQAPLLSFGSRLLSGTDQVGNKFDLTDEVMQRLTPMVAQDLIALAKERGPEGIAMTIPAIFGVGLQTYEATPTDTVYSARSAVKYARTLAREGRTEQANAMMEDNKDLIALAGKLTGLQDRISKWERKIREIEKTTRLTQIQKVNQRRLLRDNILLAEKMMESIVKKDKQENGR